MSQRELNEHILRELSAVAESAGCELLDCGFRGGVLRLVLDHPEGVTLEHCEEVSRQVSALLDVEDFGPGRYTLEVTSPGLDRKFYRPEDYQRFTGQKVRVTWQEETMPTKRTVIGILDEYSATRGEIVLAAIEGTETHTIALDDILVARLEPEF